VVHDKHSFHISLHLLDLVGNPGNWVDRFYSGINFFRFICRYGRRYLGQAFWLYNTHFTLCADRHFVWNIEGKPTYRHQVENNRINPAVGAATIVLHLGIDIGESIWINLVSYGMKKFPLLHN